MPAVLNAADEVAVEAFLQGRLGFRQISPLICETMNRHHPTEQGNLEDILRAHAWARQEAQQMIDRGIP
jgi:1-deoxy-D-xylulose-5-phosphate reductoisomerase